MRHEEVLALLGKRSGRDEIEDWVPGRGLDVDEVESDAAIKYKRTSHLFLEMQQAVKSAVAWHQARDAKARKVSAEIAARLPIVFKDEAPTRHVDDELTATVEKAKVPVLSFEEKMKMDALEAKARMHKARCLPLPLTQAVLNNAYKQLPAGAEQSIESIIHLYHANKLPASDVLDTVKSFAGSSAALQSIFAADKQECEAASEEQMRELARLAMCV